MNKEEKIKSLIDAKFLLRDILLGIVIVYASTFVAFMPLIILDSPKWITDIVSIMALGMAYFTRRVRRNFYKNRLIKFQKKK